VTLQNLDTLYANFTLPEQTYSRIAQGQTITLRVVSYADRSFAGTITAINPKIDPATRNFTVQGTFPNQDRLLRPGMFAEITVQLGQTRQVVALPASAITYNPYGDAVFVLQPASDSRPDENEGTPGEDNRSKKIFVAHRIFVKTGDTRDAKVEIREGVKPGDMVVTAGQLKLKDNARVVIDNAAQVEEIPASLSSTR
jgi:membrane fusion protein (multidrug efflux system)